MTNTQKQLILAWFGILPVCAVDGVWGPVSEKATRELQCRLGIAEDGIFGRETREKAFSAMKATESLRQTQPEGDWWRDIRYFSPEEFACKCGRYCDGYPHTIQPTLVRIADRARAYFGCPITIVSGLRCRKHNDNVGGVANSQHMYGEAADIYVRDTDPEIVLAWLRSQKDVRYAYRIAGSDNIHFDIEKGIR